MWRLIRPDAATVNNDELVKKSLSRYFAVVLDEKPAKFMIAKKLGAEFRKSDTTKTLWKEHARVSEDFCRIESEMDRGLIDLQKMPNQERSLLDLKIEIASRILSSCHLCVRACGVNRLEGKLGYCKCGSAIVVSSIFEHVGEEPELVPSGTIFTMGCTMQCKHCQNWTISQWLETGEIYAAEDLAREVERLRSNGCRNVNLVGGEPTPWLQQWLATFKHVKANVPVVWNSNSYYSPETARLLDGFVDVFLLDFKYGSEECATRISAAQNYWNVCTYNHLEAKKHGELIIRILLLPNHLECCTQPIVHWIAENLGTQARVNLMFQYRPEWRAYEIPELGRQLSQNEMDRAIQLAKEANFTNFIV